MAEHYKIIRTLGEGAFGKCFLVEAASDNTFRVIKQIDLNPLSRDEQIETLREAKILEQLNHPNIIKFREVYKTKKNKLCIVMDFADGGDMASRVREQRGVHMDENLVLDYFVQICLAMKHVHDRKILHRDLKSQNIFLMKSGTVKLGDFGIAKVLAKTGDNAKTMVGTPYYLSPEIVENHPYNFKSDIWSLGVLLYEMCALRPPFEATSIHGLAVKIVQAKYPPLPSQYSTELKTMLGQMLKRNAAERPTIHELLWLPLMRSRIETFLSSSMRQQEFSHTMLHGVNVFDKPKWASPRQVENVVQSPVEVANKSPRGAVVQNPSPIDTPANQSSPPAQPKPMPTSFFIPANENSPHPSIDISVRNRQFEEQYNEAKTSEEKRRVMLEDIKRKKLEHSMKRQEFNSVPEQWMDGMQNDEEIKQAKEQHQVQVNAIESEAQMYEMQEALLEHPGEATIVEMSEPATPSTDREDELPDTTDTTPIPTQESVFIQTSGLGKVEAMRALLEEQLGDSTFFQAYDIIRDIEEHSPPDLINGDFYYQRLKTLMTYDDMEIYVPQIQVLMELEKAEGHYW